MNKIKFTYIMIFLISYSYAQTDEVTFWRLNYYHGEVSLFGSYWEQNTIRNAFETDEQNYFMAAGIILNTNSYFYHPNFLLLDLNLSYSPDTGQRYSLVIPDRNETHDMKNIYVKTSFLQKNDLNFNFFLDYNDRYNNRENLTNIRSKYFTYGGGLNFNNKIAPVYITYTNGKGEQDEIQNNRIYKTTRSNLDARVKKSFGVNDRNEFRFNQSSYTYDDNFFYLTDTGSKRLETYITSWNLDNNWYFDKKKRYHFNSRILNNDQTGNVEFKRFQVMENISFKLPYNFTVYGGYNYYNYKTDFQETDQNYYEGSLTHQLYESLYSRVFFQHTSIENTQFSDRIDRSGIEFFYNKKIPLNGKLSLSYRLNLNNQNRNSDTATLIVENEIKTLTDGQIVLLNNQDVIQSSVEVRDATNTIVYQQYLDYILIERNEFTEIQRIPGGQIPNNGKVSVSYTAIQAQSYNFDGIYNFFGIRVNLFNNLIEFYANYSTQDYRNVENPERITLNYFTKSLYGTRFNYKFISAGLEYDNYDSAIVPYRLMRYFLILQGNINQRFFYSVNGEFIDYSMIQYEENYQSFFNISGNLIYNFSPNTNLRLESGYRKQDGNVSGIYLDLLTSRLELTTIYRQIEIIGAYEIYRRELSNEQFDLNKISLKITRRF